MKLSCMPTPNSLLKVTSARTQYNNLCTELGDPIVLYHWFAARRFVDAQALSLTFYKIVPHNAYSKIIVPIKLFVIRKSDFKKYLNVTI